MSALRSTNRSKGRQLYLCLIVIVCCAFVFALQACSGPSRASSLNAQPMYGYDAPKSATQQLADEQFIRRAVEIAGSREEGARKSIELGWKYFNDGDLRTAMNRFNQAYLLDPAQGESYAGMAVIVLLRDRRAEEAENLFRRAVESPVPTPATYMNYGRFLIERERYDEAADQLGAGLALSSDEYVLRFLRAGALEKLGMQEESSRELLRSCEDARRLKTYVGRPEAAGIREICSSIGVTLS